MKRKGALAVGLLLAAGASARCGEECYIRELLLAVGRSATFVSFFWCRELLLVSRTSSGLASFFWWRTTRSTTTRSGATKNTGAAKALLKEHTVWRGKYAGGRTTCTTTIYISI